MEKIRREIKLFWTRNGKSLLQILGFIAVVILIVQTLNELAKVKDNTNISEIDYEQKYIQQEKQNEDKKIILMFIEYCNSSNLLQAYEMLSEECKIRQYPTIEEFKEKYINKVFTTKRDCKITWQQENIYKITFLKDILQTGTLENIEDIEDYYGIKEDVFGNKTLNINLYSNIRKEI